MNSFPTEPKLNLVFKLLGTLKLRLANPHLDGNDDWNYCIEGVDIDNKKIRVIVSFDSKLMLVITVIRLEE